MFSDRNFQITLKQIDFASRLIRAACILSTLALLILTITGVFYREFMELTGQTVLLKSMSTHVDLPKPDDTTTLLIRGSAEKVIRSSKIFGDLEPPDDQPKITKKAVPTTATHDSLILIGTFVSLTGNSYAIIEDKQKRAQEVFMEGDEIFKIASLETIENQSITISRNGKEEKLLMEEGDPSAESEEPYDSSVEVENLVVDNQDVEDALNNLPILLTQARTVPYFSNGKRDGMRLFAIRSGSFFEKIGLKNGDILKSINGNSLDDQSKALELFQKLKTERRLSVKLVRNRTDKLINYEIR